MGDNEKRIAIAGADGWNLVPEAKCVNEDGAWGFDAHKPKWWFVHQLPDYLNSDNAALELPALLAKEGWRCSLRNNAYTDTRWECEFFRPSTRDERMMEIHYGAGTFAKAICEAFLKLRDGGSRKARNPLTAEPTFLAVG